MWHYEDYNIFVVLFRQLPFILLYNSLCVQLFFFCSLSLLHFYLYLLLQSIFAHEQYCTILSVLYTRLVCMYYQLKGKHIAKVIQWIDTVGCPTVFKTEPMLFLLKLNITSINHFYPVKYDKKTKSRNKRNTFFLKFELNYVN